MSDRLERDQQGQYLGNRNSNSQSLCYFILKIPKLVEIEVGRWDLVTEMSR